MNAQTAVIWLDPAQGTIQYFIINEDWRRFHNIIINMTSTSDDDALAKELTNKMYESDTGNIQHDAMNLSFWTKAIKNNPDIIIIECGFCS